MFVAVVLTEDSKRVLLERFPPIHTKAYGHHVTLAFKPSVEVQKALAPHMGWEVVVEVWGEAHDAHGQAVKVSLPSNLARCNPGQMYHITLSCFMGITPVYSNTLLLGGWTPVEPFFLKGVVQICA
jgi:hypothetical protein